MSQSFAVQEIILSRRKHIVYLKNTLAKTITHDAEMSLRKEIHDEEQDLEIFTNSEAFK